VTHKNTVTITFTVFNSNLFEYLLILQMTLLLVTLDFNKSF